MTKRILTNHVPATKSHWEESIGGLTEETWTIPIIHGVRICEFTYLLKFIYHPQINTRSTFLVIHKKAQSYKKPDCLLCTFPAETEQSSTLPSYFSSHTVNKYLLSWSIKCYVWFCFLHFSTFCWCLHCLKWPLTAVLNFYTEFLSVKTLWSTLYRNYVC